MQILNVFMQAYSLVSLFALQKSNKCLNSSLWPDKHLSQINFKKRINQQNRGWRDRSPAKVRK